MKAIKHCLALALILCLLCLHAGATPVENLRDSVVHLYGVGLEEDGTVATRWTGTGFAVGIAGEPSNVFLTNWHVATGSGSFPADRVRLWILRDNTFLGSNKIPSDGIECQVLATTDGFPDVAVLQTLEPMPGRPALPLLSSRRVLDGSEVYSLGFPGLAATHYGADSGPEDVVIQSGTVRQHLRMKKAGNTYSLIHSAAIRHGNSGGPLVNAQGVVVGQNTYGFEADVSTELFCALYIDYSMALLDELGIPYTTVPGPNKLTVLVANLLHQPKLTDAAAAGIALLALIAAVGFVLYFCKTLKEAYAELRQKLHKPGREEPL